MRERVQYATQQDIWLFLLTAAGDLPDVYDKSGARIARVASICVYSWN